MAAARPNNLIQFYYDWEKEEIAETTSPQNIATDETNEVTSGRTSKRHEIADILFPLLQSTNEMTEQIIYALSRFWETKEVYDRDEIMPIELEESPIVTIQAHNKNMACLGDLRGVSPDTEKDLVTTTLD